MCVCVCVPPCVCVQVIFGICVACCTARGVNCCRLDHPPKLSDLPRMILICQLLPRRRRRDRIRGRLEAGFITLPDFTSISTLG
uniref:Secreted protein n=1 Tax=Physcomitrium patens TaxID=3218 RepID=A0A2K1KV76_PHYPA|nr:hypothetical protein PHYPA_004662 [Physcomitrium patens]